MTEKKPQFLILALLITFGSVGAALFTPALPAIQHYFGITVGEAQLTVTSYLLGYAFGHLPYGPFANKYGRKPTLYVGLSVAIIGSLLCALSAPLKSYGLLVAARTLQALGACVGLKISYTMIADVYSQKESAKLISALAMAFAVIPGISMALGGLITQYLSWESCFYFLAIFGGFMMWLSSRLPETATFFDDQALKISSIIEGYLAVLKNRQMMTCAFIWGSCTAIVYIFIAKAPFIGIGLIGLDPSEYGLFNILPPLGMLLGSALAMRLARFDVIKMLFIGMIGSIGLALTMLIPFTLGTITAWTLFLPMMLFFIPEALVFSNIASYALSTAKNKSNASAILNFLNLCTTLIGVLLSGIIFPASALMLPLWMLFFLGVMLALWFNLKRI